MTRGVHRSFILIACLLGMTLGVGRAADDREIDWRPEKTWVFAVGVLEWPAKARLTPFPQKNRRDVELIQFFRDRGVPASQVVFLRDNQGTRAKINEALADLLRKTGKDDWLVIYYAGHGMRVDKTTYFANYDISSEPARTGWSIPSMFDAVEGSFRGSRVLLTADCCHSGALANEAKQRRGKISYATLASVEPHGTSTSNWTFTECLLRGLRGDPGMDVNRDGRIQLDELARFTRDELAFVEQQLAWFDTTNGFDPKLGIARAEKGAVARARRRVEIEWNGTWWAGHVMRVKKEKSLVCYAGFGADWDEWVGPERIRTPMPVEHAKGTRLQVQWGGKWWPAEVLESDLGLHQVHYEGFGSEWDEWVGPRRIRVGE